MGKSPFKEYLDIKARHYPKERVALFHGDREVTWKQLRERVNRLGNALRKNFGVKKGQKVAMVFWNSPEFLETHLAIQALGAVPVPLNYMYSHTEYRFAIDHCDAVALIIDQDVLGEIEKIRPELDKVKTFICNGPNVPEDWINYEELISNSSKKNVQVKGKFSKFNEALICFTGGTTGRPKGVVLTYDNFVSNLEMTTSFLASFLPPVSEYFEEEFAKTPFQRKMQDVMDAMGLGSAIIKLDFGGDFKGKTIIIETETSKGVKLPPMTITTKKDKTGNDRVKIFCGVRDDVTPDLRMYYFIGEQIRHGAKNLPRRFSRLGRIMMFPGLIKRYLLGGIKIEGDKSLRWTIIKGMMGKSESFTPSCFLPPFFHSAAYVSGIVTWILYGQPLIFPVSKKFDVREIIDLIAQQGIAVLMMVPLMWKRLLEYPDIEKFDLSGLKVAISGGSLFKGKYKKMLLNTFPNALIIDGFGQTEMSPIISLKLDASPDKIVERSIGHEIDGLEVKIVDPLTGNEVPEGEVGEMLYKSVTVMKEYYKDPEKTKAAFDKDGWFKSGDLGYRKDGNLFIVERLKECISSGAEKIYPLEVEEVIIQHPKVDEVVVIGVPDEEWGHAVRAVIIPKKGFEKDIIDEEIIEWCRGKMASYKKPKTVVFTNALPVSPVGKVLRAKVREQFASAP